jgi:hypothetical protein
MRHVTSTLVACALAGAVSAFAQEQAPAQPPAADQAPKATLTGCVAQAKTTDGGTVHILSKAEGGSATMYVLGGSSESEWSANVNKKVEVTGTVQEPASADKDSAPKPGVVRPPLMVVESMKVVAQSCT